MLMFWMIWVVLIGRMVGWEVLYGLRCWVGRKVDVGVSSEIISDSISLLQQTILLFCQKKCSGHDLLSLKKSIVGAARFHTSVRNGKRWFPCAQMTKAELL